MTRYFHLTVSVSLLLVLKRPSEILVLVVNVGNGILINLVLSFPNSNLSVLLSAIVQILCAKQNEMFCFQWFG